MALRHRPQFRLHLQGKPVGVKQVAHELGVRYVLEGLSLIHISEPTRRS